MSALAQIMDFTSVYESIALNKTGAAITAGGTYATGNTMPVGQYRDASWFIKIVLAGGSAVTSLTFRVMVFYSGADARVVTTSLASSGAMAQTHVKTVSGGNTYYDIIHSTAHRGSPVGARIDVLADNAGSSTDNVRVDLTALQ